MPVISEFSDEGVKVVLPGGEVLSFPMAKSSKVIDGHLKLEILSDNHDYLIDIVYPPGKWIQCVNLGKLKK